MRNNIRKTRGILLFMGIAAVLVAIFSLFSPQTTSLARAHAWSMSDAVLAVSPTPTSVPTFSDIITNTEKSFIDPILALLNFAAAILIAILVVLLMRRFLQFARTTNLVVDPFTNATGEDTFGKTLGGLHQLARKFLVDEMNALQARMRLYKNIGPNGYNVPIPPVPEGTSDTQLSDLLKSLKDITTKEVSTAVQLLSLVFVPRGTKVTSTLHCLGDDSRAAFSLEVIDLQGQQEPVMYTIREPLSGKKLTVDQLGERYYKMLPAVMRWLAIELARGSMMTQAPRPSDTRERYEAQVYNLIGAFYSASGQSYGGYPFFYDLAIQDFTRAYECRKHWYQPYENLAITYSLKGQNDEENAKHHFAQSLSYYNRALQELSHSGNGISKDRQPKEKIERRIEIGRAIVQARTGDTTLISKAIESIEQMKQAWKINEEEDYNELYNLASFYALVHKQPHDTTVAGTSQQNAYFYLSYSLVRERLDDNKLNDIWQWALEDPDFASIRNKLEDLEEALSQELNKTPTLPTLKGPAFAQAISNTLQQAQIIS